VQSVVLLSMRGLGPGEELFMDYRISPDFPNRPSWYEVADKVAEGFMWKDGNISW
jgi:hypothetical protein